jgi:hypothetical protein
MIEFPNEHQVEPPPSASAMTGSIVVAYRENR